MIDTTTGLPYTGDAPRAAAAADLLAGMIPGRSVGRTGLSNFVVGKAPGETALPLPLYIPPLAPPVQHPAPLPLYIPPLDKPVPPEEPTWIPGVPNVVTGVTALALGYALYKTFIDVPRENPSRENPNIPSVKTIESRLGEILAHDYGKGTGVTQGAKKIRAAMERHDGHTLREISSILSAHGVEVIRDRNGDAVATYVNMGEMYVPTVLYDHGRHGYTVTDYGSWVESYEKRHGRLP